MAATPDVVQAARDMLARGYAVVPVRANKRPWGVNWRRIWPLAELIVAFAHPEIVGVGFLGGDLSHNVVPFDFDRDEAERWWRQQHEAAGLDPDDYPTVLTPRPGRHRYVSDVRGTLSNAAGALGALGIDVRGKGQCVLPPSPHPNGGHYAWAPGRSFANFDQIPACPDFVYDAIARAEPRDEPKPNGATSDVRIHAWCRGALDGVRSRLAGMGQGQRNEALNTAALKLGRLAHYGVFSRGEAYEALATASRQNGMIEDDGLKAFQGTFASGWRAGENDPKTVTLEDKPRDYGGDSEAPRQEAPPAGAVERVIPAFAGWDEIAENSLPPRRWIVARRLLRGEVSLVAAPGGTGKSLFDVLTALAVASGRDLTGETIVNPCPVWIICNEDSTAEIQRRVLAAMRHFKIEASAIAGRLHITGADGPPVVLFDKVRDTPSATDACDAIARQARAWGVGLIIMDSLTTLHRSPEVDNIQLDAVMRGIIGIARTVDCAISLTTHTRKAGAGAKEGAAGDMDTIRGGGATVYAARVASIMATMSDTAAGQFGIDAEERRRYLRLDDAKGNYAELDPAAKWFRKLTIELANGDGVGVVEPWTPPGSMDGITVHQVRLIQAAIEAASPLQCRADRQSSKWVGLLVAPIIGRDAKRDSDAAAITQMIKTWIRNGVLIAAREEEPRQGRMVPIIRTGKSL